MLNAMKKAPASYIPPSYEKTRTTLLDECVRDVEKELAPVKDTWYTQGVSIVSDGWSNVKHKPLINVLAVNSRGAMFMEAQDFSGVENKGEEIAKYLIGAIETVGPNNVLQVVTDNAANCKKAGEEIATVFKENSKLELLKVAKTRFVSHYILLRRLMDCREALETTIVLNSFKEWFKKGNDAIRNGGLPVNETIKDEVFWEKVEHILAITKPIFLVLKFSDGDGPKMGEIYEKMDNMLGEIKDAIEENMFSMYYEQIRSIILERWDQMSIPLHCLGFALTPKFYDKHYLEKLAPGRLKRRVPNKDLEVTNGVMDAFHKIAENEEERKVLTEQYATFCMKKGIFGRIPTQADAFTMDPIEWWTNYGAQTPELAEVAQRVLSQPISSSSAKGNWSTYSYIHNVKRNRLNVKRADKLVFIHSNVRLLSRFSESYKSGPHKKWDINPENSYIEGSSTRLEEMFWEDLDDVDLNKGNEKRQRVD
ncbi:uncharacterized protein LOC143588436 [Bidens hawaiensis]|uniref:uncharacterized protein LOC143588436 n=1 Tax=Bidens hawaiensis TaxID=980011 RepID=UPI00404AF829